MIYFSHDVFSREDVKIKQLIHTHGMRGYGVFWAVTEVLHNNNNKIERDGLESIASDLKIELDLLLSVLCDFKLFRQGKFIFFSNRVAKNIKIQKEISKKRKISAEKRWSRKSENNEDTSEDGDANAMQMQCNCNAIKEKKRKENKIKKNKKSDNIFSFEEIAQKIEKEGF